MPGTAFVRTSSLMVCAEDCVGLQLQARNGELVYKQPSLEEIRAYCAAQVDTLWDEVKRFDNPHRYYVDLSQKLYDIKQELLTKNGSH